jgi:hypothetical protein
MAPQVEQNTYMAPSRYLTPEESSEEPVDSPLAAQRTNSNAVDGASGQRKYTSREI